MSFSYTYLVNVAIVTLFKLYALFKKETKLNLTHKNKQTKPYNQTSFTKNIFKGKHDLKGTK